MQLQSTHNTLVRNTDDHFTPINMNVRSMCVSDDVTRFTASEIPLSWLIVPIKSARDAHQRVAIFLWRVDVIIPTGSQPLSPEDIWKFPPFCSWRYASCKATHSTVAIYRSPLNFLLGERFSFLATFPEHRFKLKYYWSLLVALLYFIYFVIHSWIVTWILEWMLFVLKRGI